MLHHLDEVDADDPEISPQRWALSSLALFGREAHGATPRLVRMLTEDSQSMVTRLGCLEALSQIGSAHPAAVPAIWSVLERYLTAATPTADHDLALGAAEALGMVGSAAAASVPVLMRAVQDPSEDLRREAIRALGRIGSAAQDAQTVLCDAMLTDESPLVRCRHQITRSTGPTAWPLIKPLLEVDDGEAQPAVQALSGWKSDAPKILPVLEPLLNDTQARIRLSTASSWYALTSRHDRIVPVSRPLNRQGS